MVKIGEYTVRASSDSDEIVIPMDLFDKLNELLGWSDGENVELMIREKLLTVFKSCDRPKTIEDLFKEFEAKHGKIPEDALVYNDYPVNLGPPVGNEVW